MILDILLLLMLKELGLFYGWYKFLLIIKIIIDILKFIANLNEEDEIEEEQEVL